MNARVNLLCTAGAALGLTTLLVPILEVSGGTEYVLWDVLMHPEAYGTGFAMGVGLFLLGAIMALLTPAGGFLELTGLLTYLYFIPEAFRTQGGSATLALGAFLAIGSTALVLVSIIIPLGVGYPRKRNLWNEMVSFGARFLTVSPYGPAAKLRINLLCIMGASLAFISIALPWVVTTDSWQGIDRTEQSSESVLAYSDDLSYIIACAIFLVGSIVAFITPTASLAQLISLVWIYATMAPDLDFVTNGAGVHEVALGLGFYIALIGGAMVAFSLFFPIGPGFFGRRNGLAGHLFAWGKPGKPRGIPFRTLVS